MLEVKTEADRDRLYTDCQARWKSEDEVTSREMRKMLRRKMTRLSLGHLNQVMCGGSFFVLFRTRDGVFSWVGGWVGEGGRGWLKWVTYVFFVFFCRNGQRRCYCGEEGAEC